MEKIKFPELPFKVTDKEIIGLGLELRNAKLILLQAQEGFAKALNEFTIRVSEVYSDVPERYSFNGLTQTMDKPI